MLAVMLTTDLVCLVVNALWGFALVIFEVMAKTRIAGVEWNKGNREKTPELPAWVHRISRAVANHKENFPLFLTGVLVVHLAGKNDGVAAIACIVYVVARALHGIIYIAGIEGVRSAFFLVGCIATAVVYSRLLF